MKAALVRSKDCPLQVTCTSEVQKVMKAISLLLAPHAKRCEHIHLRGMGLDNFNALLTDALPLLRCLNIQTDDDTMSMDLGRCPNLEQVNLSGVVLPWNPAVLKGLVILRIIHIDGGGCPPTKALL